MRQMQLILIDDNDDEELLLETVELDDGIDIDELVDLIIETIPITNIKRVEHANPDETS